MSFEEIRFPVDISYGSAGGPEYATDIVATSAGHEQRNINWADARLRYNIAYGVKTETQLASLIAFFRARKGRAIGFRFKDWTDYKATAVSLGAGTGSQTVFQARKLYSSGTATESRAIKKLVSGSIAVYLNSVLQTSGYSVNANTGLITFTSPPGSGVQVSADFEFDVPVRFDTDRLSATLDAYGSRSVLDIPVVEVRV